MGKKSFRPEVRPAPARRQGLLQRLVLLGLAAQALGACGAPLGETVREKAHTAARWGGCIVANPPKASDLAHPSAMVDNWSVCVDPPMMSAGLRMIVPHSPSRTTAPSGEE